GAAHVCQAHRRALAGCGSARARARGTARRRSRRGRRRRVRPAVELTSRRDVGRLRHTGRMPELPEVHALASDLDARLRGRVIDRLQVVAFPALKSYDPPLDALAGETVSSVTRHGKFLDLATVGGVHLVMQLAGAGWVRWRAGEPKSSGRPGSGPLAARLVLREDGAGFDVTEAGSKKSLAIHLVRDPAEVPGIARLGPDPLADDFTIERFRTILAGQGRAQLKGVLRDQSVIAGIGNAYSDEILHLARMSP